MKVTRLTYNKDKIAKGLMLILSFEALLRDSVHVFESSEFDQCWNSLSLTFDRQNQTQITSMERWVNRDLLHFLPAPGGANPLVLPFSWKHRNHIFISKFSDDLNQRLVLNNICPNEF